MDIIKRVFYCLCLFSISACAPTVVQPVDGSYSSQQLALRDKSVELDIFAARGFLGGSDYERYHLKGDVLYRECGKVKGTRKKSSLPRSLEGDEVLSRDPNLEISERRAEFLELKQSISIKERAHALLKHEARGKKVPPLPGSVFSLRGPGLVEIHVQFASDEDRVVTSVDAVADRESDTLEQVYQLMEAVRAVGPVICNAKTFFGIGRKEG